MPTPKPTPGGSPYEDPFQFARVIPERIDMGADFKGRPGDPIVAIGPGIITEADTAWLGAQGAAFPGTFIAERITAGPAAGQTFYYAEDINRTVHRGQKVRAGQVIGHFTGEGQSELGWAVGGTSFGETMAQKYHQEATTGDPGAQETAFGKSAAIFLHSTGAPKNPDSGHVTGTLPGGWYPSGNIPQQAQTTSILSSLLGGALGGSGWKDLAERAGLIILGAVLIIVGILLLAGKNSIKIAMAGVAPEATLAEQVKANAVAMRAKGEANANS